MYQPIEIYSFSAAFCLLLFSPNYELAIYWNVIIPNHLSSRATSTVRMLYLSPWTSDGHGMFHCQPGSLQTGVAHYNFVVQLLHKVRSGSTYLPCSLAAELGCCCRMTFKNAKLTTSTLNRAQTSVLQALI